MHDVDIEAFLEFFGRGVGREPAGIGDEDVEPAERLGAIGDPGFQRRRVGDIDGPGEDLGALGFERARGFGDLASVARTNGDRAAFGDETLGDGKPDAAGRSRDENPAALQLQIHGLQFLRL